MKKVFTLKDLNLLVPSVEKQPEDFKKPQFSTVTALLNFSKSLKMEDSKYLDKVEMVLN